MLGNRLWRGLAASARQISATNADLAAGHQQFHDRSASGQSRSYNLAAANVRSWEKTTFELVEADDQQRAQYRRFKPRSVDPKSCRLAARYLARD
jgi:hypothetical protein